MHRLYAPLSAAFLLLTQPGDAAEPSDPSMSYPGAVALAQGPNGTWGYKSFPHLLPLYIFKGEPANRSLCDRDCTAVWPIVRADKDDEPVGFWSIVERDDGRFQWAYKNRPVYTYFEDRPNDAKGVGKNMDWYLDEHANAYLASVGVNVPLSPPETPAKKGRKNEAKAELLQP